MGVVSLIDTDSIEVNLLSLLFISNDDYVGILFYGFEN
jgi:hypothetical protein